MKTEKITTPAVLMELYSYGYKSTQKETTGYTSYKARLNHSITKAPKITFYPKFK